MESTMKDLNNCDFIKSWAYSIQIMQRLMKEEQLYLNELFLLSLVFRLNKVFGRPVNQSEVNKQYNILSYKFRKMLQKLIDMGYIRNDMEGHRGHFKPLQLSVTPLGEQLLNKYRKFLLKLVEG